jgi:hypothetical protein
LCTATFFLSCPFCCIRIALVFGAWITDPWNVDYEVLVWRTCGLTIDFTFTPVLLLCDISWRDCLPLAVRLTLEVFDVCACIPDVTYWLAMFSTGRLRLCPPLKLADCWCTFGCNMFYWTCCAIIICCWRFKLLVNADC